MAHISLHTGAQQETTSAARHDRNIYSCIHRLVCSFTETTSTARHGRYIYSCIHTDGYYTKSTIAHTQKELARGGA